MSETALGIVKDLFVTPNGRLFFIGSVLCGGSGYYVFEYNSEQIVFAYVVLGVGSAMIAGSMVMVSIGKYLSSRDKLEIMRLDAELREKRMAHGEQDRTIYKLPEDD